MFKSQQKAIESLGKTSSDRISLIERQLHRFDDLDTKLSGVGTQLDQVTVSQKNLTDSLRAMKKDNKNEKANIREFQDLSDKKIDALSQTVADTMTAIIGMGAQFNTMSEQVLKISAQMETQSKQRMHTVPNEARRRNTQANENPRDAVEHDEIEDKANGDKQSDESLSSASTKRSAESASSGISTYTHTSPVKKKRSRSKPRHLQQGGRATVTQADNTADSARFANEGRNLDRSFQQQETQTTRMQILQDTMEDIEGEEDEETVPDSNSIEVSEAEDETYEEDEYIVDDNIEEDDEFMTPPSSPEINTSTSTDAQTRDELRKNTAPLNPQYNENTGSAGANKN